MRDEWKFIAECIEQITLDIYVYGPDRVSKKKTWGIPWTDLYFISERIGCGAKKLCIYLSLLNILYIFDSQVLPGLYF